MRTISLQIPELIDINEAEVKIILAGEYYERGKLSLGQAAKLAGLSKRAFIEIMGNYGYSVFGNDVDEIISDIRNA